MFSQYNREDLVERSYAIHRESGRITERDEKLIRQYVREKQATQNLSHVRSNKIAYTLIGWRRFIKIEYSNLSILDVYDGLHELPRSDFNKGNPPSQNTCHDYVRILKPFLLWLMENDGLDLPEKKIRAIKAVGVNRNTTAPDEILTYEEILGLINGGTSLRDKAFISVLYESGCRVGELAAVTWNDLQFDKYGVKMYITETEDRKIKTHKNRYSRLTLSTDYLSAWKNDYAKYGIPEGNNPVFVNHRGKLMEYSTIRKMITRARTNAKITKRIHPHLFRKSRITHMIAQGYQESVIKKSMWGNIGTDMFETYVCLSEQNIDEEFLKQSGIVVESTPANIPLRPIVCGWCHHQNAPTNNFCAKCGKDLSVTAKEILEEIDSAMMNNPDILMDMIQEALKKAGVVKST